jgi:predicted alpha/beta hydrolase
LRKVGDLPRGVMAQWRRWCLNREYVVGVEGEGVRRIGHFGFFRPQLEQTLWPLVPQWLAAIPRD